MLHIKKKLFRNDDINPWITDNSVYLGSSKTWNCDLFLSYIVESKGDEELIVNDLYSSKGEIPVGIIIDAVGVPHIFELEKFDWNDSGKLGVQIIERAIALDLIEKDKYNLVVSEELKRCNIKQVNVSKA